jgi:hypothetical protein
VKIRLEIVPMRIALVNFKFDDSDQSNMLWERSDHGGQNGTGVT